MLTLYNMRKEIKKHLCVYDCKEGAEKKKLIYKGCCVSNIHVLYRK